MNVKNFIKWQNFPSLSLVSQLSGIAEQSPPKTTPQSGPSSSQPHPPRPVTSPAPSVSPPATSPPKPPPPYSSSPTPPRPPPPTSASLRNKQQQPPQQKTDVAGKHSESGAIQTSTNEQGKLSEVPLRKQVCVCFCFVVVFAVFVRIM